MSEKLHVYSCYCAWHGPIEKVGSLKLPPTTVDVGGRKIQVGGKKSHGLPCCPHCKSVLYQIEEEKWQRGMVKHEITHPGYTALMAWIEKQPKCFPTLDDAAAAFTAETGKSVKLT